MVATALPHTRAAWLLGFKMATDIMMKNNILTHGGHIKGEGIKLETVVHRPLTAAT